MISYHRKKHTYALKPMTPSARVRVRGNRNFWVESVVHSCWLTSRSCCGNPNVMEDVRDHVNLHVMVDCGQYGAIPNSGTNSAVRQPGNQLKCLFWAEYDMSGGSSS